MAGPRPPIRLLELSPEAMAELEAIIRIAAERITNDDFIVVVCNPGEDWFDAMLRAAREQTKTQGDNT